MGISSLASVDFTLRSPFGVDDFEEGSSNLTIGVYSSNPILFPTNRLTVLGSGNERTFLVSPQPGVYGQGIINIDITDTGILASRTLELTAVPGTISTTNWTNNLPLNPTVITTTSAQVSISWVNPLQRSTLHPFIIKRSTESLNKTTVNPNLFYRTIGSTFETNFIDTQVIPGVRYYYIINWVDSWITNYTSAPLTAKYNFTMGVSPNVPILFNGRDFGFAGKANKTYHIMTKPHMKDQVIWELIDAFTLASDQFVLLDSPLYKNKPIHVRELE